MGGDEGFGADDEWDADFIDQLVQAEELALSTQKQLAIPLTHAPPPTRESTICYSPPRALSQRPACETTSSDLISDAFAPQSSKDHETDRLKRELGRVTKQLDHLEKECLQLRRERDKNERQMDAVHLGIKARANDGTHIKHVELGGQGNVSSSRVCQNPSSSESQLGSWTKFRASAFNTVGVQTDEATEAETSTARIKCFGSKKLLELWNSDDQKQRRDLVSKLMVICEAEFKILFGYMNVVVPSKTDVNHPQDDSNTASSDQLCPPLPIEMAKVSHFYSVLTKISDGVSAVDDLLRALDDLCILENVNIARSSLRILHMLLRNSFSIEKKFGKRENIIVKKPLSDPKNNTNEFEDSMNEGVLFPDIATLLKMAQSLSGSEYPGVKATGSFGSFGRSSTASISVAFWVSLFEHMCQISINYNEEKIRREALSIMYLIIFRQNAYSERYKFAGELVFRCLSQVLKKEAGFYVQDQAVNILYVLFNCPKVLVMVSARDQTTSIMKDFDKILISLADCVASCGSFTTEEMKLRRNTIVFLAFLGSSGRAGFDILLEQHELHKGACLVCIILESLASDLDIIISSKSTHRSIIRMEQSLLIRETLIFLNRLVSHPQYSIPVLQALTSTREMASMSVDVGNTLTHKGMFSWEEDTMIKQTRESEIVDLAIFFKRRVFAFLGDKIS